MASVAVSPNGAGIQVGGTAQFTATPRDASGDALTGRTVTWTSSNPAVATVSATGRVTAVSAGSTSIRATSENVVGQASVTVTPATAPAASGVASIRITPASLTLEVGDRERLTVQALDAQGRAINGGTPDGGNGNSASWSSSNVLVATVLGNGNVVALLPGRATITVSYRGRSTTAAVEVRSR